MHVEGAQALLRAEEELDLHGDLYLLEAVDEAVQVARPRRVRHQPPRAVHRPLRAPQTVVRHAILRSCPQVMFSSVVAQRPRSQSMPPPPRTPHANPQT